MTPTLIAVLLALLVLMGLCGIVIPVLPGSLMVALAALTWAAAGNSSWGWICFAVVAVLVSLGMAASMLLTRRDLKAREIPRWPLVVAAAGGVVGSILLPVVGIFVGFAVALFGAEWARTREPGRAATSSWVALKSFGTGILVELGCALTASAVLATSMLTALA